MNSRQLSNKLDRLGFVLMRTVSPDGKFWTVFSQDREWTCKNLKEVEQLYNVLLEVTYDPKLMIAYDDGYRAVAA